MTTFFKDGCRDNRAFVLNRYKDRHGKWYEIRKNKLPRGDVWGRLGRLEWTAAGNRLKDLMTDAIALGDRFVADKEALKDGVDYVQKLQDRMKTEGFTVPGKDLSSPSVCKQILAIDQALTLGDVAAVCFNDSHDPDREEVFCAGCKEEIPHMKPYNYLNLEDGGILAYHYDCYKKIDWS